MDIRPYTLRTEVTIGLGRAPGQFGNALIFKAFIETIGDHHRLTVFDDIRGVIDLIVTAGLVSPPESFSDKETGYTFWRDVLGKVELQWDLAELTSGNRVCLFYPDHDGQLVPLGEWETPGRFDVVIQRYWADVPSD